MSVKKHILKRSLAAILGKSFASEVDDEGGHSSILVELNQIFDRHDALLEKLSTDKTLALCVNRVREWQRQRVLQTYQVLLAHPALGDASHFVLSHAYAGPNHEALVQSVRTVVDRAVKIFPLPLLKATTDILCLNTLTLELDIETARSLLVDGYCPLAQDLSDDLYETAFCSQEHVHQRQVQLKLLEGVGDSIEKYLGSQWVYTAFQMAQLPARKMGFGVLVDFMKPGFEAIHNLPVPANQLLAIILETEHHCLRRLCAGDRGVYRAVRLANLLIPERHQALHAIASRSSGL